MVPILLEELDLLDSDPMECHDLEYRKKTAINTFVDNLASYKLCKVVSAGSYKITKYMFYILHVRLVIG